ncbi:hypothetical protein N665_0712s0014 [Sinapis alba]|nr:hypothetical protein N665_0712s0014 [Sinapis alba]
MASSKVSSMLLVLLLLVLVFQHMDKALGEQIQLSNRKLKQEETKHHDQLRAGQRRALMGFDFGRAAGSINKNGKRTQKALKLFCKVFCPPPPA